MRKMTVMILDSRPFFRAGVRQILAHGNSSDEIEIIECDPGENGNEAMAQIAENSPRIVLLDIGYHFTTGLELGKRIARSCPGTRVVMLSANPEEDDNELFEVIRSGAVAYLRSKTCSPSELVETIRRAYMGLYPINDAVLNKPKVAWRVLNEFQDVASMGTMMEDITTPLTPSEVQILTHIARGNSNKLIGNILGFSQPTIKNHVRAILRKLNANDRANAVFIAVSKGVISLKFAAQGDHLGEGNEARKQHKQ